MKTMIIAHHLTAYVYCFNCLGYHVRLREVNSFYPYFEDEHMEVWRLNVSPHFTHLGGPKLGSRFKVPHSATCLLTRQSSPSFKFQCKTPLDTRGV